MKFTVEIPDREFWALSEHAAARGVRIADLIRAAAVDLARVTATPRDVIRELNQSGMTDAEISRRIGMTTHSIANYRRQLGLPPNSNRGKKSRAGQMLGPSSLPHEGTDREQEAA